MIITELFHSGTLVSFSRIIRTLIKIMLLLGFAVPVFHKDFIRMLYAFYTYFILFHTICRTDKTMIEYADDETEIEIDKRRAGRVLP